MIRNLQNLTAQEVFESLSSDTLIELYGLSLEKRIETIALITQDILVDRHQENNVKEVFALYAKEIRYDKVEMFLSLVVRLYGQESDGIIPDEAIKKAKERFFETVDWA